MHSFSLYPNNPPASPETIQSLALLDQSQALLRTIMLGISLQYKSLSMERAALLGCPPSDPTPTAVQTAASLVTLSALFGFQRQAESLSSQDPAEVSLGAASILIALIRLMRLLNNPSALENADDPVV